MPKRLFFRDKTNTVTPTDGIYLSSDSGNLVVDSNSFKNNVYTTKGYLYLYDIGQYVESEGGIVYNRWIENGIENYAVVDIIDINSGATFSWSGITSSSCGASSSWDGETNTNLILTQGATSGAAWQCSISTRNGKTDWYLPSVREIYSWSNNLWLISKRLDEIGGSQFQLNFGYWSSTELTTTTAYSFAFAFSGITTATKTTNWIARPVRKFKS